MLHVMLAQNASAAVFFVRQLSAAKVSSLVSSSANIKQLLPSPQEEIVPFFQSLTLSKDALTVEDCYLELAEKARDGPAMLFFSALCRVRVRVRVAIDPHAAPCLSKDALTVERCCLELAEKARCS